MAVRTRTAATGAVVLTLLLAVAAAAAVLFASAREPLAGREATLWLAVESRALDHDQVLETVDRTRYAARFHHEPVDALVQVVGERKLFDAPWLWTELATMARILVGPRGPYFLQATLFALTGLVAMTTLRSRIGASSGPLLVGVVLFGSALFFVPFRLEPRAVELAAMTVAAALLWYRRVGPARGPDDVFRGEIGGGAHPIRFGLAGGAFGVVAAGSPAYLWLALPLLGAAPSGRKTVARTCFVAGALGVFAALVLFGGAPWERLEPSASPQLLGWNVVAALVGHQTGLLPYFAPLVLLAVTAGRSEGRRWVLPAALLAFVSQLLLAPFDVVESVAMPGNAWFLPLIALLLVAAEHAEAPGWSLAAAAVSGLFLAPQWIAPWTPNTLSERLARRLAPVVELLPLPSTQRELPGVVQLEREGLTVHGFAPALVGRGDGRFGLRSDRAALLVASERPLSSVRLELGAAAPVDFEIRGGKMGNTTLRPNGDVAVDVGLDPRGARRHPVWWSGQPAWIYALELRLPKRPPTEVPLDLPYGRLAVPGEKSR